jgi:hypothetical protein
MEDSLIEGIVSTRIASLEKANDGATVCMATAKNILKFYKNAQLMGREKGVTQSFGLTLVHQRLLDSYCPNIQQTINERRARINQEFDDLAVVSDKCHQQIAAHLARVGNAILPSIQPILDTVEQTRLEEWRGVIRLMAAVVRLGAFVEGLDTFIPMLETMIEKFKSASSRSRHMLGPALDFVCEITSLHKKLIEMS